MFNEDEHDCVWNEGWYGNLLQGLGQWAARGLYAWMVTRFRKLGIPAALSCLARMSMCRAGSSRPRSSKSVMARKRPGYPCRKHLPPPAGYFLLSSRKSNEGGAMTNLILASMTRLPNFFDSIRLQSLTKPDASPKVPSSPQPEPQPESEPADPSPLPDFQDVPPIQPTDD